MALEAGQTPLWLSNSNTGLFLRRARANLGVALQPIVDINTGETVAFEALVRGHAALGFESIEEMFTHAANSNALIDLEACVIEKALKAFARMRRQFWALLFLNLDGRTLSVRAQISAKLNSVTRTLNLEPSDLCIELSERNRVLNTVRLAEEVGELRKAGYSVALDDFGVGDSGLQALYESNPSFLKIDRFFISSIQSDRKKKLMVSAIVDLAHSMGVRVIAEGVETVPELHACREIRCDLVQGYLVDHPQTDLARLRKFYPIITENRERRQKRISTETIRACIEPLPSLPMQATLVDVFEFFKLHPEQNIIPVVDGGGVPQGIVREKDLKPYVYSPYGRDLLRNSSLGIGLKDFLKPIPTTDMNSQLAPLLDLVSDRPEDGVLVTEGIRYRGVLLAGSLVRLANDMRLAAASDRNPLTGLPGNAAIKEFLDKAVADPTQMRIACYLDIDNFKPFNDKYGFRAGDRALLMFAELLKKLQVGHDIFIGHVGGDDFFVGAAGQNTDLLLPRLAQLQANFARDAETLYSQEDREAGFIRGRDREGREQHFNLLSCTVAALEMPAAAEVKDTEHVSNLLAAIKARAKLSKGSLLRDVVARPEDFALTA